MTKPRGFIWVSQEKFVIILGTDIVTSEIERVEIYISYSSLYIITNVDTS